MKFLHLKLMALLLSLSLSLNAQPIEEAHPYYLGHSLVNFDMPAMVHGLALDANKTTTYDQQIINGAPLIYQWNNPNQAQGTPYTSAFPGGGHDVFILTEAVPLQNHLTWSQTYDYAANFLQFALDNNNGLEFRYFFYETWHCTNSGLPGGCEWDDGDTVLWHPRLQIDFPLWTGIVEHVRDEFPSQDVWMIPAGQAFYHLTEAINAGQVPGISHFTDLFSDDIHLNNAGNYFVACLMFACIYQESPIGLTTELVNQWGVPFTDMPTPSQAAIMQEIAWNVAVDLMDWTGLSIVLSTSALHFQAEQELQDIVLTWELGDSDGLLGFELEHSQDGKSFYKLDYQKVLPGGSLNYQYRHKDPGEGSNYYRIKSLLANGSFTYSNLQVVEMHQKNVRIYPNPATNHITIQIEKSTPHEIRLIDTQGVVRVHSFDKDSIDITSLQAGMYIVQIFDGTHTYNRRITVIR